MTGPAIPPALTDLFPEEESSSSDVARAIARSVAGRRGFPVGKIELLLTADCNHRCDYCFVHGKGGGRDMPEGIARHAVDFLLTASRPLGRGHVLPFGGEPLLRFGLVREVVEYACAQAEAINPPRSLSFSFTTNGTLLDSEMMGFFANHGIMVLLSLDGDQDTHDRHRRMVSGQSSYREVAERLPMVKSYQPWVGTRMTVHPEVADRMLPNFEHLRSLGINQFIIGPATGTAWTQEQWETYASQMLLIMRRYAELKQAGAPLRVGMFERDVENALGSQKGKWGCGAGRGVVCVAANGSLYPCSKLAGVDALRETHKLGDLEQGFTNYRMRGTLLCAGEEDRPKCRECDVKDDCTGGCPATNYEETGSILIPSRLDCLQTRLMVQLRRELNEIGDLESPAVGAMQHVRPL